MTKVAIQMFHMVVLRLPLFLTLSYLEELNQFDTRYETIISFKCCHIKWGLDKESYHFDRMGPMDLVGK